MATIEPITNLPNGRTPPFRVEVSGTLRDPRLGADVPLTHVFLVAASAPGAAALAGGQLFGREAGRRPASRCPGTPRACSATRNDGAARAVEGLYVKSRPGVRFLDSCPACVARLQPILGL